MKTKLISVDYIGFTAVDRRFSMAMLPWILMEIRRRAQPTKLCLSVENGCIQAYDVNFELQFSHTIQNIMKLSQIHSSPEEFLYLIKDSNEQLLYCHLYQGSSPEEVSELFTQMKELGSQSGSLRDLRTEQQTNGPPVGRQMTPQRSAATERAERGPVNTNRSFQSARAQQAAIETSLIQHSRSFSSGLNSASSAQSESHTKSLSNASSLSGSKTLSNTANLTSLCADISACNSHFFEVLYIGKIKVSHKKVPETLIDDALDKFKHLELEKMKTAQMRRNSLLSSQADSFSEHGSSDNLATIKKAKRLDFKPINISQDRSISDISLQKEDPTQSNTSLISLHSPSLTPLENKLFFNDQQKQPDLLKPETQDIKETSVEREFDEFTSGRVQNDIKTPADKPLVLNKNSFPIALEPKVLILNWSQNEEHHKFATLHEADKESSRGSMDDDDKSDDSIPDYDKLMHDIKLLGQTEFENMKPASGENKEKVPGAEKSVLKSSESKTAQKVEEKTKKKVEFSMNDQYFDKDEVKDIEKETLQARGSLKNVSKNEYSGSSVMDSANDEVTSCDSNEVKKSLQGSLPENKSFERDRSASIGTLNLKTPIAQLIGDQNRTMLFQVGRTDLRLISPDKKQVLLHRHLRDVASCCQGVINKDHLGFICREPERQDSLVGYVFKCESDGVANDVVGAITQAFIAHAEMVKQGREASPVFSCEHCPMVWYHKLCQDLDGMSEKRMHAMILRRLEHLPEDEQNQIVTKYQGGTEDLFEVGEHNAFLMMLLRAHCEAKQQRHVHDTAENRSEFLNQYLGGSTIFMKAKRSLSISFDHLLKKKGTKDTLQPSTQTKKENSPITHAPTPTKDSTNDLNVENSVSRVRQSTPLAIENAKDNPAINVTSQNGRRESISSLNLQLQNPHLKEPHESSPSPLLKSPMMDIFMKLGNTPSPKASSSSITGHNESGNSSGGVSSEADHNTSGSWRQAIFNRITREGIGEEYLQGDISDDPTASSGTVLLRRPSSYSNLHQETCRKRTKEELRELWKTGINQAILLIRMEKENARLKARQEVSAVKRIKLEYEDIGGCGNENSKVWDMLTAPRESRLSTKVDSQMLLQAIKHGVPRAKRGDVWYFLAEQYCLRHPPPDIKNFPNYGTPYEVLLKQLTSHQHAILIDLGRTFPNHTYFSSPLGPGQLALFNLLKAYSLLDPEVGYCQGLSFVAGVLLLHLDEAEAFLMLRHLMFRRALRKQYLPDMVALQVQLYQLSRLVKDHLPELYDRFDQLDVSPTLYAAPWILTIFTSQFPLGFVTRVFDLLFLESSEVIFRVAIALLDIHKDGLMLCETFEEIMEYLKYKIPNIDKIMLDKVIKLAFSLDFGRQLHEYKVEYNVLQEEMVAITPKMEALSKLEKQNEKLQAQNQNILEQLEESMSKALATQKVNNKLESQIRSLEQTVAVLVRFIGTTHDKRKDSELPNDIRKLCQQVQQTDKKTLGALGQKLGQNFSSKFVLTDFTNGSPNMSGVSEESSSDQDEKINDKTRHKPGLLKSHLSTSNIFSKMSESKKDELQKSYREDPNLEKKRQYLSMKKSMSCNAGLMLPKEQPNKENQTVTKINSTLKGFPLKVLDEDSEHADTPKMVNKNLEILKSSKLSNASTISSLSSNNSNLDSPKSKSGGFFAHTQEQIRQEKLQADQLKQNFNENLKRLDARLTTNGSFNDKGLFSSQSILNPTEISEKLTSTLFKNDNPNRETKSNGDSGLGTPLSPSEKFNSTNTTEQDITASHPLFGCDVDIKFDVHSTKLKSLKPSKAVPIRPAAVDSSDSRN